MKGAVGYLGLAVVLGTVGASLWATGHLQRHAAATQEQILTLQFASTTREPGALEAAVEYAHRLPWINRITTQGARQRATSQYWLGQYEAFAASEDASSATADIDSRLLMISAHAAYRRTALDDGDADTVKRLEQILDIYAEVLKRGSGESDAAYNFEFVARRRNALAMVRRGTSQSRSQAREAAVSPPGRTLHGDRGAYPLGLEATEFKVIVPQPSDERQEQREAGSGTPRVRKG